MPDELVGIKDGERVPLSDNIEITELHCHDCDGYIKFALDKSKNGEHVVICPKCKHQHCRVIKDGKVTGDRWSSRNPDSPPSPTVQTFFVQVTMDNYSTTGFEVVGGGGTGATGSNDVFLKDAWMNTGSTTTTVATGTMYFQVGGTTA